MNSNQLPLYGDKDSLPAVQAHIDKWSACTQCRLNATRTSVVLAKGCVPADILFIGDAPGQAEDISGVPFVGPAGNLLKAMINTALHEHCKDSEDQPTYAITNVVACVPRIVHKYAPLTEAIDDAGVRQPTIEESNSCSSRLLEFVKICNPKGVVAVGDFAFDYLNSKDHPTHEYLLTRKIPIAHITHPAAILRSDDSNSFAPMYLKQISQLVNFFERHYT